MSEEAKEGLSLTGWAYTSPCIHCGAAAAFLSGTGVSATFECRGTPTGDEEFPTVYGPDRCGRVYTQTRTVEEADAAMAVARQQWEERS
jgi:hypothetical protein